MNLVSVCKKKKCSTRKLRSFCLVHFFVLFFFFALRNVKVGGAAYAALRPYRRQIRYGKTGQSKICTFLRHFMIILERNFFRASILHHITDTDNK